MESFASDKKFFDARNYPQGFQRSGDFTRNQAQLLEAKGLALKALHEGVRAPQTDEEEQFIACCQGKNAPRTEIEKTWMAYLTALKRKQVYFTASSAAVEGDSSDSMDSDD